MNAIIIKLNLLISLTCGILDAEGVFAFYNLKNFFWINDNFVDYFASLKKRRIFCRI